MQIETRAMRKKAAIGNIKKSMNAHDYVAELLDLELEEIRERYENTSPASEFLRGQLIAIKDLRRQLGER